MSDFLIEKNKIWVLSNYSYLINEVIEPFQHDKPFAVDEFNLWGGRLAGKTIQVINLAILLSLIRPDQKIDFYGVRKKIENKKEFFNTILEFWPNELEATINKTEKTIKYNNLHMEIIGLADKNKQIASKLGKTRRQSDLTIICFDEAFEFDTKDFLDILAGTGAGKQRLIFYCANPYLPSTPYFQKVLKMQPYNETLKAKTNEVIKLGREIYHYSNAYAVWHEIVSEANQRLIEQSQRHDPLTAEVVQFGKPLRLSGGIYTKELAFVNRKNRLSPEHLKWEIICGIDFGYSIDPTAIVLSAISPCETKIIILDELQVGTKHNLFDSTRQAYAIIDFLRRNWERYQWGRGLSVYCENDFAFVETLNTTLTKNSPRMPKNDKMYHLKDFVEFERVSEKYKKDRIAKRIKATLRLMASGKMSVLSHVEHLISEFEASNWKEGKIEREDKNDHFINAFEYSLAPFLDTIGSFE